MKLQHLLLSNSLRRKEIFKRRCAANIGGASLFLIYIIKQEIVMRRLILETPRLQLHEMVLDDFKSLSLILQDENVMYANIYMQTGNQFQGFSFPYNLAL